MPIQLPCRVSHRCEDFPDPSDRRASFARRAGRCYQGSLFRTWEPSNQNTISGSEQARHR